MGMGVLMGGLTVNLGVRVEGKVEYWEDAGPL